MKKIVKKIPNVKLFSNYFKCPRCDWETDRPLIVKGDIAQCPCEECGYSHLVRIK